MRNFTFPTCRNIFLITQSVQKIMKPTQVASLNNKSEKDKSVAKKPSMPPPMTSRCVKSLIPPRTSQNVPGKEKFHNLLKQQNEMWQHYTIAGDDQQFYKWFIDTDQYLERLKTEIKSIDSCISSESSGDYTRYTDDTGSLLIIEENKRIPFGYLTKPYVPFEETNRSRIKAKPLINHNEYYYPYYTVPFSGQAQIMREISQPKDRFYTNAVRARHDIRERIKVSASSIQFQAAPAQKNEEKIVLSKQYRFKPKTTIHEVRAALRKKFESQYIEEFIIEKTITQEKELIYAQEVTAFRDVCEPQFTALQERHYRQYMRKMQSLKPVYEKSSALEKTLKSRRYEFIKLDMKIMSVENCWRDRVYLQNFHYLLKDRNWRERHDWIHCRPDGCMETYRESINNRFVVNVRQRNKDTSWAVKEFYEQWSSDEVRNNIVIVFRDVRSFLIGLAKMKISLFNSLMQLHFSMWLHANLEHDLRCFKDRSDKYLWQRSKYVTGKCAKKDFIEERTENLQRNADEWMEKPLYERISDKVYRTVVPLCKTMVKQVFPDNFQSTILDDDVIDSMTLFMNLVMNLFEQRDQIPSDVRKQVEKQVKNKRAFEMRRAQRMCALEARLKSTVEQMKKNLAPPYKAPKRVGKLARSWLPKAAPPPKKQLVKMAEIDKLYYKAFTETDPEICLEYTKPSEMVGLKTLEANCIPFYFDYFLQNRGYFPVYDFRTDIEVAEGDEEEKFYYRDVLDDVLQNLKTWTEQKAALIQAHIVRTFELYKVDSDEE